jgi:hypothetical protein
MHSLFDRQQKRGGTLPALGGGETKGREKGINVIEF